MNTTIPDSKPQRSRGRAVNHFVVEDAEAAGRVLEHAAIRISEVSELFVLHKDEKRVTGKPGSFGVDDVANARRLLE